MGGPSVKWTQANPNEEIEAHNGALGFSCAAFPRRARAARARRAWTTFFKNALWSKLTEAKGNPTVGLMAVQSGFFFFQVPQC